MLIIIGRKAVQGYEMRQEARAIQHRIEQLKQENRQLGQELDYLHSDQYVEKVAREQLGLVRPGDVAVTIVGGPDQKEEPSLVSTPTPPTPTPEPQRRDTPNWQRWLSLFTGQD